jgi:hypothetical protein
MGKYIFKEKNDNGFRIEKEMDEYRMRKQVLLITLDHITNIYLEECLYLSDIMDH